MCQATDRPQASELADKTATAPSPCLQPPLPLQFISVGQGGKVSNLRKVRSHVSREYHSKKKAKKKQHQEQLEFQKKAQLRPNQDDLLVETDILDEDEEVEEVIAGNFPVDDDREEREKSNLITLPLNTDPPPSGFVHKGANRKILSIVKLDYIPM
jgi:hypothetical protein